MAQYQGKIQGSRGQATRLGTKSSGLETQCNGWNVGATARLDYNGVKERDEISLYVTTGSNPKHDRIYLGRFFINDKGQFIQAN